MRGHRSSKKQLSLLDLSELVEVPMLKESFDKLKSNLELSESLLTSISQKQNAVRSVLEEKAPHIKTKLIGSLQRQTRIHPRPEDDFDIDILVILGEFIGWDSNGVVPDHAMEYVHSILDSSLRYSALSPTIDDPTVTFSYANDLKVEFVPAYLDKDGQDSYGTPHTVVGRSYWVAKSGVWSLADYDYEADFVSEVNSQTNGWFIPTVKMLKALRRMYFPQMTPHHLEIIASKVIPGSVLIYQLLGIPFSFPRLVADFFEKGISHFATPVAFTNSQTPAVILSESDRVAVTAAFKALNEWFQNSLTLDDMNACLFWKSIFGEPFPHPNSL